jgi:hypothetical protein
MDINTALYFSNGNIDKLKRESEKINNKDYRFYKKRIFNLYKDLMLKKEENQDLLDVFHNFNKKAIEYLKFKDKASILQEEYEDLSNNKNGKHCFNTFKNELLDKVEYSNHILMKDYNVKTKTISDCIPLVKKKIKEEKKIILPQKKKINLKDEKFKLGNKKNINNNYEKDKDKENKEDTKNK